MSLALSVVVPVKDEAENAGPLAREIAQALKSVPHEIIFVDDGSSDGTAQKLTALRSEIPQLRVLRHQRNLGQSRAIRSGVLAAKGEIIGTLDGDGQNDPADTRRIWDAFVARDDNPALGIVCGRRTSRNDSGFKWVQARLANGIRRFCLKDDATDTGCGFKLIRTRAFFDLPYFAAMHRFLPALLKRAGWEVREEPVVDRVRLHGVSKYGFLGRLGAGVVDLLGMMWLVRRGGYGIAAEWNDPRAKH